MSTQPEILDRLRACAVEILSIDGAKVVPEARLNEDLEADSLDLVELIMRLEEEFDISIDESELENVETVQHALDLVQSKLT